MTPESENLLKEALELSPIERATLVDRLLTSLDKPDDAIDEAWRKEIAARLRAYRSGTAATVSADDVLPARPSAATKTSSRQDAKNAKKTGR